MNLIDKAARISAIAHRNQVRKQEDVPYIMHPVAVALSLAQHNFSDEVVAAALVHDVLEDTDFPESELRAQLGDEVMRIVHAVSNDDSLSWEEKKAKYVEIVRKGGESVWAVAIADKIHNAKDLIASAEKQGSAIWNNFNRGKEKKVWFEELVLAMFREEGWQHSLVEEYATLIERIKAIPED
ncbi:phosphohydrolase [Candidatus Kaiserbacteria bacterium CG10_big_fil_rev_8_21_14_0_10_45_20]|uniref:Phosphohydrolase n=1 Tax=Candidatus Kaiserbacteria bacterium CG10_big_fil_rev_8_21_14_0_10_45_20 TaxID=1974607 RepID=A0A2H0UFX3_9BACT|nr:MAG: phosphohydrolase [Candidatus Kaiserbacteria bacterium CG10_big_fil_rev_8_21_14_0_10_45_20]